MKRTEDTGADCWASFHVESSESEFTWLKVTVYYERRNFRFTQGHMTKEADPDEEDGNIYI